MKTIIQATLALMILVLPVHALGIVEFSVPSFTVLNCTFNGNVSSFTNCINSSAQNKAKDAVTKALEDNPIVAQLGAEQQLLFAARAGDLAALAECLGEANIDLGATINAIASNPSGTAANRLQALTGERLAQLSQQLTAMMQQARAFTPANVPTPQVMAEQAFDQLMAAAALDPIANCGRPLLAAQKPMLKQVALTAYDAIAGQINSFTEGSLRPAALAMGRQVLKDELAVIRPKVPSLGRRAKPMQRRTTNPQGRQRAALGQARATKAVPRAPRTRSAGSFLEESQAQATEFANQAATETQALIAENLPDGVERIALAELSRHLYASDAFPVAAAALDDIADGNGNSTRRERVARFYASLELANSELYSRVAISTIEVYGEKAIDKVYGKIIGFIFDLITGSYSVVDNIVSVGCATGTAVVSKDCEAVKSIVEFMVSTVAKNIVEYAIVYELQREWAGACECARSAIGLTGAQGARGCDQLGPLLQWLPLTADASLGWVMPHIGEHHQNLVRYHDAVNRLVGAGAGP